DLRLRLPEGLDGLEAELRKRVGARIRRGSITISLKLLRSDAAAGVRLNAAMLEAVLAMLSEAETRAEAQGFALAPMTAADLLSLRGVIDTGPEAADPAPLIAALLGQIDTLIDAFDDTRQREGAALEAVLDGQVAQIAQLQQAARRAAEARRGDQFETLRAALARLTEIAPNIEPGRLEQELALIAVKTDITEELDRLEAHCAAARALLESADPVGRKLDFLMQEFNREANTLCAKSQHGELTRIGLDLKTVIDQMREQVQNLE
ncbi:YicC/YloC family endoribonuclease, partial [Candidatus Oleimmundimicrobium sp.]|uniref:YicC/YloC family endoribonuclease n=1 Tax=Candidatus Oleimmundimicrobium sp. TaxID=3060597 RepID=UPI00271E8259